MIFYKHYIGDFQRDTGHLSLTEKGAYRSLLDFYYATEKPLPIDVKALYRLVGAMGKKECAAVMRVLDEFWQETNDGWVNARALMEIGLRQDIASRNRENGKKGGRPKKTQTVSDWEPKRVPRKNLNHSHSQNHSQKKEKNPPITPPKGDGEFDRFWAAYPRKKEKGNGRKAFDRAIKRADAETIISGAMRYSAEKTGTEARFIKHPASWLNADCWLDEPDPPSAETHKSPAQLGREAIFKMMQRGNNGKDQRGESEGTGGTGVRQLPEVGGPHAGDLRGTAQEPVRAALGSRGDEGGE